MDGLNQTFNQTLFIHFKYYSCAALVIGKQKGKTKQVQIKLRWILRQINPYKNMWTIKYEEYQFLNQSCKRCWMGPHSGAHQGMGSFSPGSYYSSIIRINSRWDCQCECPLYCCVGVISMRQLFNLWSWGRIGVWTAEIWQLPVLKGNGKWNL